MSQYGKHNFIQNIIATIFHTHGGIVCGVFCEFKTFLYFNLSFLCYMQNRVILEYAVMDLKSCSKQSRPLTQLCIGNLTIIGSDNGLSPAQHQAII